MTADSADKRGMELRIPVAGMTSTGCLRCGCRLLLHDARACGECGEVLCAGCMGSHVCRKWERAAVVRFQPRPGVALDAEGS